MKILFAFLFCSFIYLSRAPGKTPLRAEDIIYNPDGNSPGLFVISYKDYEDIRIDSNLDGKIDFWKIKKGPLQVELFFKNGEVDKYYVRKISNSLVAEFSYASANGRMKLLQARTRAPLERGYSSNDICETSLQKIEDKLKEFKTEISRAATAKAVEEDLIDPSCQDKFSEQDQGRIQRTVASAIEADPDHLSSCFDSEKFAKAFDFGENKELTKKILKSAYSLQKRQFIQQSSQFKSIIKCELSDKKDFSPARTDEHGNIIFVRSSDPSVKISSNIKKEFQHELLHRLGFFSEETVKNIMSVCEEESKRAFVTLVSNANYSMSMPIPGNVSAAMAEDIKTQTANLPEQKTTTKGGTVVASSNVQDGIELAASASTANIPASMAVAQIEAPVPAKLSEVVTNPLPQTDAGSQQALVMSAAESSGVLRAANNMVGALSAPAIASTKTNTVSEAATKTAAATTISDARVATSDVSGETSSATRVPASVNLGVRSRNALGSDEKVVESITLDSTVQPTQSTSSAKNLETRDSRNGTGPRVAPADVTSPGSSDASSSGGFRAPANASSPELSPSSPQMANSTQPSRRNQARADITTTKEEVITFISRGDYTRTKQKLKDPNFNRELETQSITVLDLHGNSYGAPKGSVIFLDQGDRFVRQK